MWLDVMGGGLKYHGAEFRLNFHHQHNAFQLMNEKGAERWIKLMVETLDACQNFVTPDRVDAAPATASQCAMVEL